MSCVHNAIMLKTNGSCKKKKKKHSDSHQSIAQNSICLPPS